LGIAVARGKGVDLPPVSLTRVGATYFCRDGHHRISVARALGERTIEARVVEWEVDSLPLGEAGRGRPVDRVAREAGQGGIRAWLPAS
jgi:hypothetical protein